MIHHLTALFRCIRFFVSLSLKRDVSVPPSHFWQGLAVPHPQVNTVYLSDTHFCDLHLELNNLDFRSPWFSIYKLQGILLPFTSPQASKTGLSISSAHWTRSTSVGFHRFSIEVQLLEHKILHPEVLNVLHLSVLAQRLLPLLEVLYWP